MSHPTYAGSHMTGMIEAAVFPVLLCAAFTGTATPFNPLLPRKGHVRALEELLRDGLGEPRSGAQIPAQAYWGQVSLLRNKEKPVGLSIAFGG